MNESRPPCNPHFPLKFWFWFKTYGCIGEFRAQDHSFMPTFDLHNFIIKHPNFMLLVSNEISHNILKLWCWKLSLKTPGLKNISSQSWTKILTLSEIFTKCFGYFKGTTLDTCILSCVNPILMILDILNKGHVDEQLPKKMESNGSELSEI